MDPSKTSADIAAGQTELKLDFSGLLGSNHVFAAGADPRLRAEMIDANCNKVGSGESCCTA